MQCEIKFEVVCKTDIGQSVCVVGNIPQLGNWNSRAGIPLKTDEDNYPTWYSETPLMFPKGKWQGRVLSLFFADHGNQGGKFQFKFVKRSANNENQEEWEIFANNLNRLYRTRFQSVTLKALWNDFSGREVANKKFASSNTFSNSKYEWGRRKLDSFTSPSTSDELQAHKFKISGMFVPYEQAGSNSSEDSLDFPVRHRKPTIELGDHHHPPSQSQQ